MTINPVSEPAEQELKLVAFDADGNLVPTFYVRNSIQLQIRDVQRIASFQVLARPYVYLEFDGIHYDPDSRLWKDIVFGPTQQPQTLELGDVTAELKALVWTKPGSKEYNSELFVTQDVYTPEGRLWKDHPENFDQASASKTEMTLPTLTQKAMPRPWIGLIDFKFPKSADSAPVGRVDVFGSDSMTPGEDLHADWSLRPVQENIVGELTKLPAGREVLIALSPKAKVAQIRVEVASGDWKKETEVIPDPEDIRSTTPEFRIYTLCVGPQIRVRYRAPGGKWVDKVCEEKGGQARQTRVFARMKSGERIPLEITSYTRTPDMSGVIPCYDLDKDATETEGDMIALRDIRAFEIEERPIRQGYMVVKLPPVGPQ